MLQCSSLLDESCKEEFLDDITDLYEDIREDHYESLIDKKYLSLEEARTKSLKLDWKTFKPTKPKFFGTKVFHNYDLEELVPIIDWRYFFDVWQLRGRYPNGRSESILLDSYISRKRPGNDHIHDTLHSNIVFSSTTIIIVRNNNDLSV